MDVLIPSLGDIDEVEVIELCIEPGAAVATGDTLIVIESDKASMDVPDTHIHASHIPHTRTTTE